MEKIGAILNSFGIGVTVEEKYLDAVTGLSGSGPAYVFLFMEALADGGVQMGLTRDVALKLAMQTVYGAARMAIDGNKHLAELKDEVTSPGGTTIAGLYALEQKGFRGTVMDVMIQAYERRALTDVPTNQRGWQVEMANIGQHYFDWRYKNDGLCPGAVIR